MRDYDQTNEQQQYFEESILELQSINKDISSLVLRKENITKNIIGALEHGHNGQKSYEYKTWKIEVKTPLVFSLNKKLYESGEFKLPKQFNPIKKTNSYTIDKKMVESCFEQAPEDIRDILVDLIEVKPGKASVIIKERV